jgi:hypothetical protein
MVKLKEEECKEIFHISAYYKIEINIFGFYFFYTTMQIKHYTILAMILFAFTNCQNETVSEKPEKHTQTLTPVRKSTKTETATNNVYNTKGYALMKQYCFACHFESMASGMGSQAAPPVYKLQKQYKLATTNKEHFIKEIMKWVQDPKDERMLLNRAVFVFGKMPKINVPDNDLRKIAETMYDLEYPPHQSRMKVRMPLNNGRKWQIVGSQMKKFEKMVNALKKFKGNSANDYQEFGWEIVKMENSLVLDPEESPRLRTKFYLFFFEITNDIRALMASKSVAEGEKNRKVLLSGVLRYTKYFEEI